MKKTVIIIDNEVNKGWAQDLILNFKKIYEKKANEKVKIISIIDELKKNTLNDVIYIKRMIKKNSLLLPTIPSIKEIIEEEKPNKIIIHSKNIELFKILKNYKKKNNCKIILISHDYYSCCSCSGNSKYYQEIKKNPPTCEKYKISLSCIKCIKNKMLILYHYIHHLFNDTNLFDIVISPSEHLGNALKKYGYKNVKVIPNGIDLNNWKYYGYKEYDHNLFLFVGKIIEHKGIYQLLEAFSEYVKENKKAKLLMIGTGHEEDKVKKLIEIKNLEKNVKLIGFVEREKLREYYKKCICLIVPSIWMECFGMVLIEAMATGKVVIGSNFGGPYEIISKSKGGFVFNPFDTKDFVKTLKKVHSLKKEELEKIGLNGRKWVEENCNIEKYVDNFIKLMNL